MADPHGFESAVLPWLDSACNQARWLLRDAAAAEDVVQESALRALRYFHAFKGGDARVWFLGIVRNACFTYLRERQGRAEQSGTSDAALEAHQLAAGLTAPDPATLVEGQDLRARIDGAIAALPPLLRQMIVLRAIQGFAGGDPEGRIAALLERRARHYDSANLILDTEVLSVEEVVTVLRELVLTGGASLG